MAEERRQLREASATLQRPLGQGRFLRGEGQTQCRGEDPQGTEDGRGCPPFRALPPWPTLPPGPPPFHQHLFNRNIKGPGPATTPPFASI